MQTEQEKRRQASLVLKGLKKTLPRMDTALDFNKPWQLLVAVLLSAQTTDANVNRVTQVLFRKLPSVHAIAQAPISQIENLIFSTGYYHAKARNLKACCQKLVSEHNGNIPYSMEELIKLPGVGRKTANVILHVLGHEPAGIVMDTHIARVTMRLGFIDKKDPKKAEEVMMKLLPTPEWKNWGDYLIQHGRRTCSARKPKCEVCVLADICPSAGTF